MKKQNKQKIIFSFNKFSYDAHNKLLQNDFMMKLLAMSSFTSQQRSDDRRIYWHICAI